MELDSFTLEDDKEKPVKDSTKVNDDTPVKAFKLDWGNLPEKTQGVSIPTEQHSFKDDISESQMKDVGDYFRTDDVYKKLHDNQSNFERLGNTLGRIVTQTLGGTVEAFGATYEGGASIVDKIKGENSDFNNSVMDFGRSIDEWGVKNMPNYRANPGKSWDVSDPAWWFEGAENAASTLQFIIPQMAAVKGITALSKLAKAEQFLVKAGLNANKFTKAIQLGAGAAMSRNAENMMESFQVRQTTKEKALQDLDNEKTLEEVKNSEIGDEVSKMGKELTKENIADYIAAQAGWKSYQINSANIIFDAIQLQPLLKGFDPSTRKGILGTSSKVTQAQNKLLNNGVNVSAIQRMGDFVNPMINSVARQATEGVEEMVNYIGTEEGKALANKSLGEDTGSFTQRMAKYLKSGDFYEAGFWGTMGGAIYEGSTRAINKAKGALKGLPSNTDTDNRINEIEDRVNIIKDASSKIKEVQDSEVHSDEEKKDITNQIKSELALDLGVRAAQAGNTHLLIDFVKSPEYKKVLEEQGIAHEGDVEKATAKTIDDITKAESLYKQYYNNISTKTDNLGLVDALVGKSITYDFLNQKAQERINNISNEIADLKAKDAHIQNSTSPTLESTIHLKSLEISKNALNQFLDENKDAKDNILSSRGKKEIERIDADIKKTKELIGENNEADISGINPEILTKQSQVVFGTAIKNINTARIAETTSLENIRKEEEKAKEVQKQVLEKQLADSKATIEKEISEGKHTPDTLKKLRDRFKKNKPYAQFLDSKIKELTDKETVKTAKEEVNQAQETEATPLDDIQDLPKYETKDLTGQEIPYKADLDNLVANKQYIDLRGFVTEGSFHPNTVQYARNLIEELKSKKDLSSETTQLNNPVETGGSEGFEIDESQQEDVQGGEVTLDDLEKSKKDDLEGDQTGISKNDLAKKLENRIATTFVPLFSPDPNITPYQIENGNIVLKDEYVKTLETLMDKEFTKDTEVEIYWDKDNKYTHAKRKGKIEEEAFGIRYKGVTVAWLGTKGGVEYEILKLKRLGTESALLKANDLELDLVEIMRIRKQLELSDKVFKTKIIRKGNGTVISRGTKSSNSFRSITGMFNGIYGVVGFGGGMILTNLEDNNLTFEKENKVTPYRNGVVYGALKDANGKIIPVPLQVSKLNQEQSTKLRGHIQDLMSALYNGLATDSNEVKDLKDKISKYIKVDRSANFDKGIGFRVFPRGETNKEEEIRFTYYKGKQQYTVLIKNNKGNVPIFLHGKNVGNKVEWDTKKGTDKETVTVAKPLDTNDFLEILQEKYNNIDYSSFGNKAFTIEGKTYPSYKEYLEKEEILKTDVAQVVNSKNEKVSDLFGFNNDFKLEISSELDYEGKNEEESKLKGLSENLLVKPYEVESENFTNDLEYRKKYNLFNKVSTIASETLKNILDNAQNDNIKDVARFLQSNIHKNDLALRLVSKINKEIPAFYSTDSNTISVSKDFNLKESILQQTLLHEILHGLTVNEIGRWVQFTPEEVNAQGEDTEYLFNNLDGSNFKEGTPQYVKDFVLEIGKIKNEIENEVTRLEGKSIKDLIKDDNDTYYGFTNTLEFISEVMVNPKFRNKVRQYSKPSTLERIYNSIVSFLNKYLKTNLKLKEVKEIQRSVNIIKNFIDKTNGNAPAFDTFSLNINQKLTDKFSNEFSRNEINEIVNLYEGLILRSLNKETLGANDDVNYTIRDRVSNFLREYKDSKDCPESCKAKVDQILNHYHSFFSEAKSRLDRQFKIENSYDLNDILEEQGLQKEWEDNAAMEISSQETVTKEIKKFIKTIPELNSVKVTYKEDGTPLFDTAQSSITGLNRFVDFNSIYPYMIRNLIGARSRADILDRLDRMSLVYPSFAYIKHELEKNDLLLTQFEVNLAHKNKYNSYITLINNIDDNNVVIQVINEGKSSEQEKSLANKWTQNINLIIDNLDTDAKKETLRHTQSALVFKILGLKDKFEENKGEIRDNLFKLFNNIGVELSLGRLENDLNNARTFADLKPLLDKEDFIRKSILSGKKYDSFGNLNELAKNEALFSFDIVENVVMSIDNKPLYIIRNPNFLSNWFSLAHSDTTEGKQEFEKVLRDYAKVPELETSNWLWGNEHKKDGSIVKKLGFIDYRIENGKKIPVENGDKTLKVNSDFIKTFNFNNFNGAKELVTNNAQKYADFNSNDYDLISLINYLKINDKEKEETKAKYLDYAFYPILIPADSSSMYFIHAPRFKIGENDITFDKNKVDKINKNSQLYQAVLNTVRSEIRKIKQTQSEIFDVIDNKLVVKKDLDVNKLQQYYHYEKELTFNEDGTPNLLEDGKPIGKGLQFQNMIIKEGDKFITLNDVEGIFINNALIDNTLGTEFQTKISDFVEKFVRQEVEQGIKEFSKHLDTIKGKHNFIVNGSNNHLIAEFVLNTYIANKEQTSFFTGEISNYKSGIDTNKRAKSFVTPGESLSEEAMKYTRKNGSINNGKTFTGVTIKDVITTSKTIDFIIKTTKDALVQEKKDIYTSNEINNFENKNITSEKPQGKLEEDVYKKIKSYLAINAGDAQGYTTLDRYEQIHRGRGKASEEVLEVIKKVRKGQQLTTIDIQTLKPIKGFYYDNSYDNSLNKVTPNLIKYSTFPLIPQLVYNTELEKLMKTMETKGIDEAFFESAHKVGAKRIYSITDENNKMDDSKLKDLQSTIYYNKSWQLQLEVPEHLRDEENLLATQISKLIIANLNGDNIYDLDGEKFSGEQLKEQYFRLLNTNIIESANGLLEDLGIEKVEDGFLIKDENIAHILEEEINKRGLSENYKYAIEINERGQFKLPLFTNNMSAKWEAILTSLFTNRIMKQKLPGASAVLASRLFLDNQLEQKDFKTKGVEWIKEKEDKTLKSFSSEDGKTRTVEVLLGAWSSKFFKDGKRISIDDISEELRTMIGYRIPTDAKHQMIIFKVVGFLPEENKQLIVTPDDLVVQMGSDFDIDKLVIITQNFKKKGDTFEIVKFVDTSKLNEEQLKKHYNQISGKNALKAVSKALKKFEQNLNAEEEKKLIEDIFNNYSDVEDITDEEAENKELQNKYEAYWKLDDKVNAFPLFKDWKELSIEEQNSLQARQNKIFNIYKSILTNPEHFKEIIAPTEFQSFINLKNEINDIFGINDKNINPLSIFGQRTFRSRNITGRALKGVSANLNAFGAVSQHTKMYLNEDLAFKFKFNINNYNAPKLRERYGKDLEIKGDYAYIKFSKLGYAPDGSYLNVDGDLILEHASQGIGAAVDVVKDPTFEAFNATTYTYPIFHTMLLSGIPTRLAGMFIRQPIVKFLNDYYFENKSLLGDNTGKEIETVKKYYQTVLAKELEKSKLFDKNFKELNTRLIELKAKEATEENTKEIASIEKKLEASKNVFNKLKKINKTTSRGYFHKSNLIYLKRDQTNNILGYDPDDLKVYDVEELKNNLIENRDYGTLSPEKKIEYLRTQLQVIEYFNKYKKAAEGVQDVMQATKTDGIGAGPNVLVTNELVKKVNKLGDPENKKSTRILIDGQPAVLKVYPKHFGIEEASVYPVIETNFEYVNKLSAEILKNLFIQQTRSYQETLDNLQAYSSSLINEEQIKYLFKYLNTILLKDFSEFNNIPVNKILGTATAPGIWFKASDIVIKTEVDNIDEFNKLSTANKVLVMQNRMKDILNKKPQHILNFLKPILDKESVDKNKYHKVDFVFYKNELTDDNLVDSFIEMYNSSDEFEKGLAKDLIKYSYITNGLSFGFGSFSKVIPNEILVEMGLDNYLREKHEESKNGNIFDLNTLDKYFRNSWGNNTLVPQVRNKFQFDETTKKIKVHEETGELLTKDNTPNWNDDKGIIQIHKNRFREVSDNVTNSTYLLIKNKDGSKLFKKFIADSFDEFEAEENRKEEFVYYFQIDKLGKDGIIEDDTIFEENKSPFNESDLIAKIEERRANIKDRKIAKGLNLPNISDNKIDEQDKKCN